MTNQPSKPIMLFDCKTSQSVIGQDKFLDSFKTILNHGGYAQGPETRELDEKLAQFCGSKYCSTCGSGTDALTLALMAWNVKAGDAVFVSSFTFVASAEAPVLLGATPIFVDSDPNTYNMDPKDLQRAIDEVKKEGKLTPKVVIPVDIFGSPCDYDAIKKIAHGDGGAVFTNSNEENEMVKSCRVHGMSPEDHYDNIRLGMTGRMNSFQGAVLLLKMTVFEQELKDRFRVASRYDNELSNYFGKQKILDNCKSAYALYTITCEDRDELAAYLKSNGIPCGTYYPRPVHTQTAYAQWNTRSLPVCEKLSKTALSIPMTPYLDNQDLDYVINCMNEFAAKKTSKAA